MDAGYAADSGPSRSDTCRLTFHPIEASKAAIRNGCFTSVRDIESVATTFRFGSKADTRQVTARTTISCREPEIRLSSLYG